MEAADVIRLYDTFRTNGIALWIDGGWGVDALLGRQTRPHRDLDVAIEEKDVRPFRGILDNNGYREIKPEIARPHNFVVGDGKGREIDVHVVVLDDHGNGIYGPVENGERYPAASLTGTGRILGREVTCISAEWLVRFHSGYELTEKDFGDVSTLCETFGIELPEEYRGFHERG